MRQQLETPQSRALKQAILTCVALVVPNIVLWTGLFVADGIIIQRDFNFPIFNENFEAAYFPLWNDVTSQTNMERFPRLVMMAPFIGLSMLGVEVSVILKVMIVGAFTFMSTTGYLLLNSLLKHMDRRSGQSVVVRHLLPIIGAYLFAYTPVSIQFAWEISFLVSIGTLPLMLYFVITHINHKLFPVFIASCLAFSLAHPFLFIVNAIVVVLFALFIFHNIIKLRVIIAKIAVGGMLGMAFLAWLWLPYLSFPVSSTELGRDAHLERDIFDGVSDNNVFNILFLERDKFAYIDTKPTDPFGAQFHYIALALLVGVAFVSLFLARGRISRGLVLFFSGSFATTSLFALGSTGAIGELYWAVLSESGIGWIFRSPLKFQLYQGLFISILFTIALVLLAPKIRVRMILPILAITALVGAGAYGIHDANWYSLNPIPIPEDYTEINQILRQKSTDAKVIYLPRYNEMPTYWSQGHMIAPFDMKSSMMATHDTYLGYNYVKEILYEHPYPEGELNKPNFYEYLTAIGVKYIVFHNDRGYDLDQRNLEYLQQSNSLTNLYSKNDWYLFEIKNNPSQFLRAVSSVSLVYSLPEVLRLSTPNTPAIDVSSASFPTLDTDHIQVLNIAEMNGEVPLPNKLANGKFDTWEGSSLGSWTKANGQFGISSMLESGGFGIQISTPSFTRDRWSGLISEEIEVEAGKKYLFTAVAMTQNAYSSHIKIQGYSESALAWKDIVFISSGNETATGLSMDANTDWKRYWNALSMPEGVSKVRFVINAGGVSEIGKGDANTYIREAGVFDLEGLASSNAQITYDKVSATNYNVTVKSEVPFILVFSEAFDKGWIASDSLQEMKSFPVYGMLNGFYIEKPGDFTLTIDYRPQKLFALGATISIAAVIGILLYTLKVCYDYFIKNGTGKFSGVPLTAQSSVATFDKTLVEERTSERRPKADTSNTLFGDVMFNSPIIAGIALVALIPLFLAFEDTESANLVAFFALDLMIIGCMWMAIGKAATKRKTSKPSHTVF